MLFYFLIYLSILFITLSLPQLNYLDITEISYLRSCLYIHEFNFLSNLIKISNIIYTIDNALELAELNPKIKLIAKASRETLRSNYHKIISLFISNYKHKELCISKLGRTVIFPIENLDSLENIKFTDNFINYIGDSSLSNPNMLSKIIEIDFNNGTICLDCKDGRFVVISESYKKELAYYKILTGIYNLSIVCIPNYKFLDNLELFSSYLTFCE